MGADWYNFVSIVLKGKYYDATTYVKGSIELTPSQSILSISDREEISGFFVYETDTITFSDKLHVCGPYNIENVCFSSVELKGFPGYHLISCTDSYSIEVLKSIKQLNSCLYSEGESENETESETEGYHSGALGTITLEVTDWRGI